MSRFIVQFSTGLGSTEYARRLINEHGSSNVVLLTADTRVEDSDNWRFAHEFVDKLGKGVQWHVVADGRTPMQAGRDERCVPNNRMTVCSRILKREILRRWIDANCDPATDVIAIGFDWTEPQRWADAQPHWLPFTLAPPLENAEKWTLIDYYRNTLGIEPPRLYAMGMAHANCGGACVRGGQNAWARLLDKRPEVYAQWEAEEQVTRVMLGKDVAILKDRREWVKAQNGGKAKALPLDVFRRRIQNGEDWDRDDEGACGCDPWTQQSFDFDGAAA